MKQIKLEVGKTYRNRRGEEVKIVEKQETVGRHAYRGSDDEWYTERGRFNLYVGQSGSDLIEEVPSETTRHTFVIPDGVKEITLSYEGKPLVVEMVPQAKEPELGYAGKLSVAGWCFPDCIATPEEPKPGDVLKEGDVVYEDGRIMIVKMYPNLYHAMVHNGNLYINREYGIPFTSAAFRPATPEEAQPLWDALKKAGKRWNPKTMQVEEIPEIDRIREWVRANFNYSLYTQVDVSEAIERYLKHKEGKK